MTATITDKLTPRAAAEISFDFSPKGAPYVYTAGATTFAPAKAYQVVAGTPITFTATATFYQSDESAGSYEWDFGDGSQGFGATAAHTYTLTALSVQVVLKVTDNKGGVHRARRQIYLQPGLVDYRTKVIQLGPSMYWPLDTTYGATDQSTNGRNGTAAGGVTIGGSSSSPFVGEGTSTLFDGVDDRVTSGYNPYTPSSTVTFTGWANRNTSATNDSLVSGLAAARPLLYLWAGNNDVAWVPDQSGGGTVVWSAAWPGNSQWVPWALVVVAGTSATLYINGALVSTLAHATNFNATPGNFEVGGDFGANNPFDGKMGHVAIFPRALTLSEISSLTVA